MQKNLSFILPFAIAALAIASCKKNTSDLVAPATNTTTTPPPPSTTSTTVVKDSTVLVSRDIYLWNTQIPSTFNAQQYDDPAAIMTAIRPFSLEPGFSTAVDRWSFAMKKTEWDQMSAGIGLAASTSSSGDFGFSVFFRAEGDLRVRLVEPNSPSGIAAVHRGWRITAINGNTNITTANADFIVNAVYESASANFTFTKPDGSSITLPFTAAHYAEKPVYLDTVYQVNGSKVGYLVYNSFLGNTTAVSGEMNRVFSSFASQGVSDVVIDLRYNGGGYVSLAEQMGNYLVKSAANGQLMMTQTYNAQNSSNNSTTMFHKAGSLNLPRIYFIVGRGTASASELLINNLKPYMDVRLIGPSATHGKPVGFFPTPVGDWYVFPVSFKTTNKNGEGNYYNGLPVNAQVADGLDKEWGDITENCLASALRNISSGSYRGGVEPTYTEPAQVGNANDALDANNLKVTIGKK